jgi:hypothetical protein
MLPTRMGAHQVCMQTSELTHNLFKVSHMRNKIPIFPQQSLFMLLVGHHVMRPWGQDPVENINYRQAQCDRKDEQTLGGCFKSVQQAQY